MKVLSLVVLMVFAVPVYAQPPQAPRRPPQAPSLEERVLVLEAKISALQGIPGPFAGNLPVGYETWLVNGQFVQVPAGRTPAPAGAAQLGGTFGGNCANGSCGGPSSGGRRGLFGRR